MDVISSAKADYKHRSPVGEALQRSEAVISRLLAEKTLRSSVREMASDKYQSAVMKT